MQKLININIYFRVVCFKNGKKYTEYVTVSGLVDGYYTEEDNKKHIKEIREHYLEEGYFGVSVKNCSKEEFETKGKKEYFPIGYITIYLKIYAEKEGKQVIGFAKTDMDFTKYITEEVWDLFSNEAKSIYVKKGFTNIKVMSSTKKEYNVNTDESDPLLYQEWNDKK